MIALGVFLGLFWLGICVDSGLKAIANALGRDR